MWAEIERLARAMRGVIGIGKLAVVDDSGAQQKAQLTISAGGPDGVEEVIDGAARMGHYGFAYCPPDGSEAVVIFVGGRRSAPVIIADGHRASRFKNLKPGEAALYNGLTGDFVRMCEDGKIRSKGDWEHDGKFHASKTITSELDIVDHTAADGTGGVTLKVLRDDYNAHKHGGVTVGGALTAITDHPAT